MNKNGMTLVELIAVIAILAILSLIAVPAVNSIRENSLEKDFNSKISIIEDAALDYANENLNSVPSSGCLIRNIGFLVINGYLSGDDDENETLINPTTNESMNEINVCVKFDSTNVMTRKLVACIEEIDCLGGEFDETK